MASNSQNECRKSYILEANTDNVKNIVQLLKAVFFKEIATIVATQNGFKVTVEDAKCVQATAFIQSEIFHEYVLSEETVCFSVNLRVLLECLNIFGTSNTPGVLTALKMCYGGYGSPLILILEENGVVTDCRLNTMEPYDLLDFDFSPGNVTNKIIMQSDILKEVWNDLDTTSDVLQILMSPDKPYFQLSTFGNAGTVQVEYSRESEMIETFNCTRTQSNRYKINLLKPSVKALLPSTKVSIRTDERGLLCLQYMIKTDDGHVCFVEYYCVPDEEGYGDSQDDKG